jgi:thiol-disulfide isomerase/thioredoxin
MKKVILFIFVITGFYNSSVGQILWFTDFDQALKNSFKTGRKVLVECYHPECPHCNTLNENLKSNGLAQYLNENYTNYKINLSERAEVALLEKNGLRLMNYPIFLFFDSDGNFIYYLEPKETPQEIIQQFEEERGNSCLDCEKRINPSIKDNVRCATFYRIKKDYLKSNAICSKFIKELPAEEKASLDSWNVFKKVVLSTDNTYFDYWITNSAIAAKYEQNTNKEKDVFFTIISYQIKYLKGLSAFEKSNLEAIRHYLSILGGDEKRISSLVWDLELAYFLRQKDFKSIAEVCDRMHTFFPDASTYNFLLEYINEKLPSNEMHAYFLTIKDQWLEATKDEKQKMQFYKQAALFYGKNGDKTLCKAALDKAILLGLSTLDKTNISALYLKTNN